MNIEIQLAAVSDKSVLRNLMESVSTTTVSMMAPM